MKKLTSADFKRMTTEEIKNSPCMELTSDGQTMCIVIVGAIGEMKVRIEGIASMIDAGRGK